MTASSWSYVLLAVAAAAVLLIDLKRLKGRRLKTAYYSLFGPAVVIAFALLVNVHLSGPLTLLYRIFGPLGKRLIGP